MSTTAVRLAETAVEDAQRRSRTAVADRIAVDQVISLARRHPVDVSLGAVLPVLDNLRQIAQEDDARASRDLDAACDALNAAEEAAR